MHVMPERKPGRYSVGLIGGFFLCLLLLNAFAAGGQTGGDTFLDNPLLSFTGLAAVICAVAAFIAAIVALAKKELALMVWVALVIGALVTLFLVGEFTTPH